MPREIGDHPEIAMAMATGYPSWNQPKSCYCDLCERCLDDETIYADSLHENLCKDCLLTLHEKTGWW